MSFCTFDIKDSTDCNANVGERGVKLPSSQRMAIAPHRLSAITVMVGLVVLD